MNDKYERHIDAEQLKHILNNSQYYGTQAGRDFADMIAECNTAIMEKVHWGSWIDTLQGWRCSVCGKEQEYTVNFKRCPECGARMIARNKVKEYGKIHKSE